MDRVQDFIIGRARQFTFTYVLGLCALTGMILLDHSVLSSQSSRTDHYSRLVNVAGRQRMLCQRLAKASLACVTHWENVKERQSWLARMETSLNEWESNQQGLRVRCGKVAPPGNNSPEVERLLELAHKPFEGLTQEGHRFLALASEPASWEVLRSQSGAILAYETDYIWYMERLVDQYVIESESYIEYIRKLRQWLFWVKLAMIVVIGVFVLRPASRRFVQHVKRETERRKQAEYRLQVNLQSEAVLNQLLSIPLREGSLREQLEQALEIVLRTPWLRAEPRGGIFLTEDDGQTLRLAVSRNIAQELQEICAIVPFGQCACGVAAETGAIQFATSDDTPNMKHFDGITRHQHYSVPIRTEDGRTCGVLLTFLNADHHREGHEGVFLGAVASILAGLIERKETDEALRESESLFRDIAESTSDWVWVVDRFGVYTYCSGKVREVLGYEVEEILGKTPFDFMPEEEAERVAAAFRGYVEYKKPFRDLENWNKRKDGALVCMLTSGVPVLDDRGELLAYRGVDKDVTASKQIEIALRESEAKLKAIFDTAADGIITIDEEGMIESVNPASERMFGYHSEEMTGRNVNMLIPPPHQDKHGTYISRYLVTGQSRVLGTSVEFEGLKSDGTRFPIELSVSELKTHEHRLFTGIARDISDRKRAEAALASARASEQELRVRIQESLLQSEVPIGLVGVEVGALSVPSRHMDGDFYDFHEYSADVFDLVVGDVMGKGTTAALVGAAAKNHILKAINRLMSESVKQGLPEPEQIVNAAHRDLTPHLISLERFVTLGYARFLVSERRVCFVNCGHTRTLHYRGGEGRCYLLPGGNMPLGFTERERYTQMAASYDTGDMFVFYSDGVTDALDASGIVFSDSRLMTLVEKHAGLSPSALALRIRDAVSAHVQDQRFTDDLTCIVVSFPGETTGKGVLYSMSMASDFQELPRTRAFVRQLGRQSGLNESETQNVVLAVNEAVSNVMRHAYGGKPGHLLKLEGFVEKNQLMIRIQDDGKSFSREEVPEPSFKGDRSGGFGVFIMEHLMDEVRYERSEDQSNVTWLIKKLGEYRDESL